MNDDFYRQFCKYCRIVLVYDSDIENNSHKTCRDELRPKIFVSQLDEFEQQFLNDIDVILSNLDWDSMDVDPPKEGYLVNRIEIKESHIININLSYLNLPTIPESIVNLSYLENLDLSNNLFEEFPSFICSLENLRELNLESNEFLSYLHNDLGNLLNLEILNLNYCPIRFLPESIGNLKNLKVLLLSGHDLMMYNLDNDDLMMYNSDNDDIIHPIPDTFGDLVNLKHLTLYASTIGGIGGSIVESLPSSFSNLFNLEEFNLNLLISNESLEIIAQLKSLKHLSMRADNITKFPNSFSLLKLESLSIYNYQFDIIPDSICKIKSLKMLSIRGVGNLKIIPDTIDQLSALEELMIHAQIIKLPNSIGNLQNLEYISLSNNHITCLPDSFGNLINLRTLMVDYNSIVSFPESMANLQNLEELAIHGNCFSDIPKVFKNADIPQLNLRKIKELIDIIEQKNR